MSIQRIWDKNTEFDWFRSRMLGGRTNHWGRISLRFGPKDFQPNDGVSERWPITYEEVKPYYDKVDRLIGVYGTVEGLENDLPAPVIVGSNPILIKEDLAAQPEAMSATVD